MISVIVPVYNASQFLDQCISSILNQSYSDIELILVDDYSRDGSLEICHKYAAKDGRVKVLSNFENKGQVYSYVKGIKEAKGDFISFVDSDDWISLNMIEKLYTALCDYDADISACGCWHIYDDHKVVEPANIHKIGKRVFLHQEMLKSAESVHVPGNSIDTIVKLYRCNKIFKKNILLQNLKFIQYDTRVFEDNNLVIPCILDANKIIYVNEPLYYYRRRKSSTMSLFNKDIFLSNFKFLEHLELIYSEKKVHHDMKSDVFVVCSYSLNGILKSNMPLKEKCKYLKTLNTCFQKYKIKKQDLGQYVSSSKFRLLCKLLLKKYYWLTSVIGKVYYQLKG